MKTSLTLLISFLSITVFAATATNDDNLVLYLSFDETAGHIARDQSGNEHHGTFRGTPKRVQGKFGNALEFDGKKDYVVVRDNNNLDMRSEMTICAWFCPTADLTNRRMLSKNDSFWIIFDFAHKQTLDFLVKPNNAHAESTTTQWKIGKWYHCAGTFDGKIMKVYINGELEGVTHNNVPIVPSEFDLWIGADDYGRRSDHFPGKIDEVRLYDKALTKTEIQTIMYTDSKGVYHAPATDYKRDVNGDGVISIQDLVFVASAFGTSNPDADVNGDGEVDIFDLIIIANGMYE